MTALGWGRRFLMTPPEHFEVLYEINPWMHREVAVDADRAMDQWRALVAALVGAGAAVETLEARRGLPDLVFTANAGVVDGSRFVPSRFHHPQRQAEVSHYVAWFESHGYKVVDLPSGTAHEGAGDALPFGKAFLSGSSFRSDAAAADVLAALLDVAVVPVHLADPRLYHLDLTFCPLDDRRAMVAPGAWTADSWRAVESLVPEPLVLSDDEALAFCANSVVVDRTVVMPTCPPRIGRRLEAWGFDVVVVEVDEFLKAGGGCRCLTLALDVDPGRG
ncbi:MAG: dimethylarginine dimethylaminohydrolase family protein [Acidimicrobiales bacterium]